MKPEAVVFDLGRVLLHFDYSICAAKLEGRCARPFAEVLRMLDQSPLLHRYECNQISTGAFFAELRELSGFRGDIEELQEIFSRIFTPIEPMIELNRWLRRSGVPTCIFSNTNELAVRHIRGAYPFFAEFDHYILSCEHGAMKPDPRLYAVVEQCTRRRGRQLLYIDDRTENVAAGRARGWRSVLHQEPDATIRAVRRAGLPIPFHLPGSD